MNPDGSVSLLDEINRRSGARFTRLMQALARARGDVLLARSQVAGQRNDPGTVDILDGMVAAGGATLGDYYAKASQNPGTTSDSTWAGPLSPLHPTGVEFVSYLRPLSAALRLDTIQSTFFVSVPRADTGVAATYFGEGVACPVAAMSFSLAQMTACKLGVIIPATMDLIRFGYDAQAILTDDMARACAAGLDAAFFDPNFAGQAGVSPASITHGVSPIDGSGGSTASDIAGYATAAMLAVDSVRIPVSQCTWVGSQRLAIFLTALTTTTGAPAFPGMGVGPGATFFGLPFIASGNIVDSSSPAKECLILVHGRSVAVAGNVAEPNVSGDAAIQLDSAPGSGAQQQTSLWQANLIGLKVTLYHDHQVRRSGAVQVVNNISV